MHDSCYRLFAAFVDALPPGLKVLDVGSYDVNGCLRPLFEAHDYTGCDQVPGPNVDVVQPGPYALPFPDGAFDVLVSANCLEHCPRPWQLVLEMDRVLRPGGLMAIEVPFWIHQHRYPVDCWRLLPDGLAELFGPWMLEHGRPPYGVLDNRIDGIDTWFVGRKAAS
jgi:SAM-dependent methyltransferase